MTTQEQVLEAIEKEGAYTAILYEYDDEYGKRRHLGLTSVTPAHELVEKGVLRLHGQSIETATDGTSTTYYVWTRK